MSRMCAWNRVDRKLHIATSAIVAVSISRGSSVSAAMLAVGPHLRTMVPFCRTAPYVQNVYNCLYLSIEQVPHPDAHADVFSHPVRVCWNLALSTRTIGIALPYIEDRLAATVEECT